MIYDASTPAASRLMRELDAAWPAIVRLLRAVQSDDRCELIRVTASGPRRELTGYEDAAWYQDNKQR